MQVRSGEGSVHGPPARILTTRVAAVDYVEVS